jgi:hypothetical protein
VVYHFPMVLARNIVNGCNTDYPWNEFDAEDYFAHNYVHLRDDDREIVTRVRDHFASAYKDGALSRSGRGIDVGTGANLYPALTMLPFCADVTLFEYSESNINWLEKEKHTHWPSWDSAWHQFWPLLRQQEVYDEIKDPRTELANRTTIRQDSVYDLGADEPWDIGTMFFVAESITRQESEFRSAVDHFLDALKPGAPFAIAFMEHSVGYRVADQNFPATDIDENDVVSCLRNRVGNVPIKHVGTGGNPLRQGYTGMLIALGRVGENSKTPR